MKLLISFAVLLALTNALPSQSQSAKNIKNVFEKLIIQQFQGTGNKFQSTGDKMCTTCQKLVSSFDQVMSNSKFQTDITNVFDLACKKITDQKMAQTCDTLIDKGLPMVMKLATTFFNPSLVCEKMFKICPSATTDLKTTDPTLQNIIDKYINDLTCAACACGFGFIQQAFWNQDFGSFVIEEIQPACDGIADAEKQQKCKDTVQNFVGIIFNALNKYVTPEFLCETNRIPVNCPTTGNSFVKLFKQKN